MIKFLGDHFWRSLLDASDVARRRVAVIAYVTVDVLGLSEGDTLIVDASDSAIAGARTSARVLQALAKRGVSIFSYDRLHAKFVILDLRLFVSSANCSKSSKADLFEAGIVTDSPSARAQALSAVEQLKELSRSVDDRFIARIRAIPVVKPRVPRRSAKRISSSRSEPKTWLAGVHSVGEPKNPTEQEKLDHAIAEARTALSDQEAELAWCSFQHGARISKEAAPGDSLILIWRDTSRGEPTRVLRHQAVVANHSFEQVNRLIYVWDAEGSAITWPQFKKLAQRVGLKVPTKNMIRELSSADSDALAALWNTSKGITRNKRKFA